MNEVDLCTRVLSTAKLLLLGHPYLCNRGFLKKFENFNAYTCETYNHRTGAVLDLFEGYTHWLVCVHVCVRV